MTASPGREVDRNLLRGGALGSAQACPGPDDAGGQDLGDLVEALGGGHEVGAYRVRHVRWRYGSDLADDCFHFRDSLYVAKMIGDSNAYRSRAQTNELQRT